MKTLKLDPSVMGHISDFCKEAVRQANKEQARVEFEFNGTPGRALPGDLPETVEELWHVQRLLIQTERGIR